MGAEPDYSEEMAREIDDEIRRIIEEAHARPPCTCFATTSRSAQLSAILIERETIDKDQFEALFAGEAEEEVFVGARRLRRVAANREAGRENAKASRSRSPAPAWPAEASRLAGSNGPKPELT